MSELRRLQTVAQLIEAQRRDESEDSLNAVVCFSGLPRSVVEARAERLEWWWEVARLEEAVYQSV